MKRLNWIVSGLAALWALLMFVKVFFLAMSAQDFITLVASMRRVQKAYFRNGRKYSDLIDARKLEREVDQALKDGIVTSDAVLDTRPDDAEPGE